MAQTSGTGGIGSLAIGGIAAVVVIVGGVVLVQLGVFEGEDPSEGLALREGRQGEISISPSTANPAAPPGTGADDGDSASAIENDDTSISEAVDEQATDETVVTPDAPEATEAKPDSAPELAPETDVQAETDQAAVETDQAAVETAEDQDAAAEEEVASAEEVEKAAIAAGQSVPAEVPPSSEEAAVPAPSDPAEEVASEDAPSETATEEVVSDDTAQQEQPASEDASPLAPPALDLVRVDPDGAVVIAGRAVPGAAISVLLDGSVLELAETQGSGEFVVFTSILPSQQPRVISLLARLGEQEAASLDQFILAPAAPVPAPTPSPAPVPEVAEAPVSQPEAVEESSTELAAAVPGSSDDETTQASAQEQGAESEPVQTAQARPEPTSDTSEAQETAPPVKADADGPEQPSEVNAEEIAIDTAAADVVETAPETQPVSRSAPSQGEEAASAETEPAPEPQATSVAVLRAGADGVELVQPAAPVLGGKVALDTISYSERGEVLLAGRARAGALIRVYVNNALTGEMPVGEDSRWGGALDGIEPGIYTLRLDEVDATDGAVLSRLETPFKREAPEVLQPPAQVPGAAPDQPVPLVRAVTVQKGDTLWAISQERYGSGFLYVRVFEANQDAIRDPDLIYPGQVFNLPE